MKLNITIPLLGFALLISLCHAQNLTTTRDQMASHAFSNAGYSLPVASEDPGTADINRPSSACDTIMTLYASNNGLSGVMFDVVAHMDMTVVGLTGNMTGTGDIAIFYRHGSHLGQENDSTQWTLAGSSPITPNPSDTPTPIPITLNLDVLTGDTLGLYVASLTGLFMRYTDAVTGVEGDVYCDNGDAAILQGSGVDYPFGFTIGPRIWNGTVDYCDVATGIHPAEWAGVSLYPNPLHDATRFTFNHPTDRTLELFDCNGKRIRLENMTGNTYELQRKNLSNGLYFFRIVSDNEIYSGRLIVQ